MKDKRSSSWVELTSEVVENLEDKASITKTTRAKNEKYKTWTEPSNNLTHIDINQTK